MKINELFSDPEETENIIVKIYDEYKKRHNLLLTDELKRIRKMYKLSLRDFSKILGVGYVTYHRYENGAIQDIAINNLLELIKQNPKNFLILFNKRKNKFIVNKQIKIKQQLDQLIASYKEDLCKKCPYYIFFKQKDKTKPIMNWNLNYQRGKQNTYHGYAIH